MLMALANQILVSGMTFAVGIGVARLLGIGDFGKLALVMILQLFVQYLQGCFVVSPMMALTGRRPRRSQAYFAAVIIWSGGLSALAGLAVVLVVSAIYGVRDGAIPFDLALAAGSYTVVQNLLYTARRILFAQRAGWQAVVLDSSRYAIFAVSALALWQGQIRFDVALTLWLLAGSGLICLWPLWQRMQGVEVGRRLLGIVWARHLPIAKWLALMLILTFGQEQAVALGLGATLSDEALGGLRAGQYLIGTTHFIWVALENFVPRRASRAFAEGGIVALSGYLWRTTLVLGAVVWGIILVVSIPAEMSLRLTFGAGYEQFAPILRIYGVTYAIAFAREVWVFFYYPIERTQAIFQAYAAGFVVALIVFLPAIKTLGVTGAAVTALLASTTSTLWVVGLAWRHIAEARNVQSAAGGR